MRIDFPIDAGDAGRSAAWLLRERHGVSASFVKTVRIHGRLLWNGQPVRMKEAIPGPGLLQAWVPDGRELPEVPGAGDEGSGPPRFLAGQELPGGIDCRYADAWLYVVEKPAGLVVHPTTGHGASTLTERLRAAFGEGRLHPVNRLDRDTSGLMILARNALAHDRLSRQHGSGAMRKVYLAAVHGCPDPPDGRMEDGIERCPGSIMLRRTSPSAPPARSRYRTLETSMDARVSVAAFVLESGRTHQIRVHCLLHGVPILGDSLYGIRSRDHGARLVDGGWADPSAVELDGRFPRQALHAAGLAFLHPVTGESMAYASPWPADLRCPILEAGIAQGEAAAAAVRYCLESASI